MKGFCELHGVHYHDIYWCGECFDELKKDAEERDGFCGDYFAAESELAAERQRREQVERERDEAKAEAATLRERVKALEDAAQKLVDAATDYQYNHDTYGRAASVTCESFCRLIAASDECGVLLLDTEPAAQEGGE